MRLPSRRLMSAALLVLPLWAARTPAADYFWNPASPTGNWASNPNWSTPANGPTYTQNWADSNTANFTGANQTVTVNSLITIAGINFTANGIQVVSGGGASDLRLVGSVPISVSGANTATIAEQLNSIGAGSELVKQGTGTLVLSGANSITDVTVAAGTLKLGNNSALGSASLNPGLVVDGTLDLAGFSAARGELSGSGTVTSSTVGSVATLTVGSNFSSGTTTFGGTIQNGVGTVALTKTGVGTLVLNSANTYSGGTTISGGTLQTSLLAPTGTASGIGTGGVQLGGGTLEYTGGAVSSNRSFTLGAGTSTISSTGTGALNLSNTALTLSGIAAKTLVLNATTSSGNNTFAAPLADNGAATSLSKTGTGTWVLTGNNSYTGATTISGGTLSVAVLANGGSNSGIGASTSAAANLVFDGGTLRYTGAGSVVTDRAFTLNAGGGTIDVSASTSTTLVVSGGGTGAGGLIKAGVGILTLTGASNYTAGTTVSAGTLRLGNGVANGSVTGNITNNATLQFNNPSAGTFAGAITGTGNLSLVGAGTQTFTGANTYTGTTGLAGAARVYVAAGGTLAGSGAGAVTVGGANTLGGEGTVGGSVVAYLSGSTLDVGDGVTATDIGTLTFSNALDFQAGAGTTFHFSRVGGNVAGVGYDRVNAGAITLGGAFTAQFTNTGSNTFTTMTILSGASRSGFFSNLSQGAVVTDLSGFAGTDWAINYTATGVDLVPIPEPASVLGVAAAGLGLARWVRRRRAVVVL